MRPYLSPGVYVEEISTLPPSVAEVATAIPAFIGYTAKGEADKVRVEQVNTLLEYELAFGKATETPFVAGFKEEWWNVYREGGDEGLREYYRTRYRVQSDDLPRFVEAGDLVLDEAFARFQAERTT